MYDDTLEQFPVLQTAVAREIGAGIDLLVAVALAAGEEGLDEALLLNLNAGLLEFHKLLAACEANGALRDVEADTMAGRLGKLYAAHMPRFEQEAMNDCEECSYRANADSKYVFLDGSSVTFFKDEHGIYGWEIDHTTHDQDDDVLGMGIAAAKLMGVLK